jgi:SPP1 family predicted phage head-tail adaptor
MRGLLNSTATIRRYTEGAVGDTGHKARTWADHATAACRIEQVTGRERVQQGDTAIYTHRCWLPYGTDVTEDDRIVVGATTYELESVDADVAAAKHHVMARLREVDA